MRTIEPGEGPSTSLWDILRRTPATLWNALVAWRRRCDHTWSREPDGEQPWHCERCGKVFPGDP